MRRSTERRTRARDRSRFRPGPGQGGRDLIRFRRNQELFWREISTAILWIALAAMLVNLSAVLFRVSHAHLGDRPAPLRYALPILPLAAVVFCAVRVRRGVGEILEIRREQKTVSSDLRARLRIEDPPQDP